MGWQTSPSTRWILAQQFQTQTRVVPLLLPQQASGGDLQHRGGELQYSCLWSYSNQASSPYAAMSSISYMSGTSRWIDVWGSQRPSCRQDSCTLATGLCTDHAVSFSCHHFRGAPASLSPPGPQLPPPAPASPADPSSWQGYGA